IADNKIPAGVNCPTTRLAPGQSTTCLGTYITNQNDVDAGSVTNSAIASGDGVFGTTNSPPSSATVNATALPAISITKTSGTVSYSAPGDIITYNYLVTNTGNKTLTSITIA